MYLSLVKTIVRTKGIHTILEVLLDLVILIYVGPDKCTRANGRFIALAKMLSGGKAVG